LVGKDSSGKAATIDAIRYALLTLGQNFIRAQPEDFHLDATGNQATDILIRYELPELDDGEKRGFAIHFPVKMNKFSS
jgi:putative ATP-dependent endonuclease of OLD family